MGDTFEAHALAGVFFLIWAFFQTYQICYRYFYITTTTLISSARQDEKNESDFHYQIRRSKISAQFYASNIYDCRCCSSRHSKKPTFPLHSIILIASAAAFIAMHLIFATIVNWRFVDYDNYQHVTLYLMLILYGVVEALMTLRVTWLPHGTDYAVLALAYGTAALLMSFHLHGRDMLNYTVHALLAYTTWASAAATIVEMCARRSVIAALARTFATMLMGLWLVVLSFIMYPQYGFFSFMREKWDAHNHSHIMMIVTLYVWTIIANVFITLAICVAAYYISLVRIRRKNRTESIKTGSSARLIASSDEDDDVEQRDLEQFATLYGSGNIAAVSNVKRRSVSKALSTV